MNTINNNTELIFEEQIHLTGITEYGVKWSELLNGEATPGPEGVRFDLAFEGTVNGPDIKGTINGVDYLKVRADGKFMLNIQAMIITDDGKRIAVEEDGVLYPKENGTADLQLNLQFTTHHPEYAWLNHLQVWAVAKANTQRGEVEVKAYKGHFDALAEAV